MTPVKRPAGGMVSSRVVPAIARSNVKARRTMNNRYPPEREADLITAAQTFHDVAALSPVTYSLTAAQCTSLGAKLTDFKTKWDVCQVPSTRTKVAVQEKNASKADLVFNLRSLVKVTQ